MFEAHSKLRRHGTLLTFLAAVVALCASPARGQLMIKNADETMNIKFGVLIQPTADWNQNAETGKYAQNLFLRRFRILLGGQIMPGLTFFAETDNPNLGKSTAGTKTISSGFIVQDAYLEYRKTDAIFLDAGLIFIPFCRFCVNGASTLMSLDYGANTFAQSAAVQGVNGRDTGFELRGYLADDHLEYRAAVEQGLRSTSGHNSFRYNGRVQYSILDPEKVAYFYPGTYFGKKKMLIIGGGVDIQNKYRAYAGDVFFDYPVGPGSITAEGDYTHFDGSTFLTTLPKQNDFLVQAGYCFGCDHFFPYLRYESKHVTDDETKNDKRYQVGLGYFLKGHNATIKAAYTRIKPETGKETNQYTVQLQAFYF